MHDLSTLTPPPGTRVLIVDDDPHISELLETTLRFAGFSVATAGSGGQALRLVEDFSPHILVLDVLLPDIDGFELARGLRRDSCDLPVLFLTARSETADKITGLTLGGDDYVTKPFSVGEVIARLSAVLRRTGNGGDDNVLRYADLELDEDTREVRRGGRLVELSPTEYRMLRYLLLNAGRVVSKAQILDHVWQYGFGGEIGVVEKFISNLRRKLGVEEPQLLQTVRGFGYALRLPGR